MRYAERVGGTEVYCDSCNLRIAPFELCIRCDYADDRKPYFYHNKCWGSCLERRLINAVSFGTALEVQPPA